MTVAIETTKQQHTGDGVATVLGFPSGWDVKNKAHLRVIKDTGSVRTILTEGVDYTVSLTNSQITMTVAPAIGTTTTIRLYPPLKQEGDLRNRTEIDLGSHEDLHDARQRQLLRHEDDISRAIRLPESEAGSLTKTELARVADRAGGLLGFDTAGNIIITNNEPATIIVDKNEADVRAAMLLGGRVFVRGTGSLTLTSTWTFPVGSDLDIEFDPRIDVSLGSAAIVAFTVPASLTGRRRYRVSLSRIAGGNVASQYLWTTLDTGGLSTTTFRNMYSTGFRVVPYFQAGDSANYLQTVGLQFIDCENLPPTGAANEGVKANNAANTFSYPAFVRLIRTSWTDPANPTRGYKWDADVDIVLEDSHLSLVDGTAKINGFSASGTSSVQGSTDDATNIMECWGRSAGVIFAEFDIIAGITLNKCQLHFMAPQFLIDGIGLEIKASISLRANGICVRNLSNYDATHDHSTRFVEITADDCSLIDCRFRMSNTGIVAAVRNYGQRTRGIGLCFSTSGGSPKTWDDVGGGGADYTMLSGCTGLGIGAGPVLSTNARVDGAAWYGAVAATVPPAWSMGLLDSKYTNVGNVGAGIDDLQSIVLAAKCLARTGQVIFLEAWGETANNGNAKTLTMAFGGTTIMTQALTTGIAGTWRIRAIVIRTGNNTQRIFAELFQLATVVDKQTFTDAIETDTADITIKCTGTATTDNDIVQKGMTAVISG
jgi:hypothetical protein